MVSVRGHCSIDICYGSGTYSGRENPCRASLQPTVGRGTRPRYADIRSRGVGLILWAASGLLQGNGSRQLPRPARRALTCSLRAGLARRIDNRPRLCLWEPHMGWRRYRRSPSRPKMLTRKRTGGQAVHRFNQQSRSTVPRWLRAIPASSPVPFSNSRRQFRSTNVHRTSGKRTGYHRICHINPVWRRNGRYPFAWTHYRSGCPCSHRRIYSRSLRFSHGNSRCLSPRSSGTVENRVE